MRMRLDHPRMGALGIGLVVLLCVLAPDAVASELQGATSQACGAAVALALAFIGQSKGDSR